MSQTQFKKMGPERRNEMMRFYWNEAELTLAALAVQRDRCLEHVAPSAQANTDLFIFVTLVQKLRETGLEPARRQNLRAIHQLVQDFDDRWPLIETFRSAFVHALRFDQVKNKGESWDGWRVNIDLHAAQRFVPIDYETLDPSKPFNAQDYPAHKQVIVDVEATHADADLFGRSLVDALRASAVPEN